MKKKLFPVIGLSILACATVVFFANSTAFASMQKQKKATAFNTPTVGKITPWEAMSIAAKASGGKPLQAMYEFDEGHWVYGVVVVKNHKLFEVELDPTTGKVGDTEGITPAGEAKEIQAELAKAASEK